MGSDCRHTRRIGEITGSPRRNELLAAIARQMNGAAAQAMEDRGLRYGLNYGVSVVAIRECALRYAPDHQFAKELYGEDIRELRLAATMIADPAMLTPEELPFWAAGITTEEVAEHLAMRLTGRSALAPEVFRAWIGDRQTAYCALLTALHFVNRGGERGFLDPATLERLRPGATPGMLRALESLLESGT